MRRRLSRQRRRIFAHKCEKFQVWKKDWRERECGTDCKTDHRTLYYSLSHRQSAATFKKGSRCSKISLQSNPIKSHNDLKAIGLYLLERSVMFPKSGLSRELPSNIIT